MSLRTLRQTVGLMPGVGCPSIMQDVPTTPPAVEASAVSTLAPTSSLVVVV